MTWKKLKKTAPKLSPADAYRLERLAYETLRRELDGDLSEFDGFGRQNGVMLDKVLAAVRTVVYTRGRVRLGKGKREEVPDAG